MAAGLWARSRLNGARRFIFAWSLLATAVTVAQRLLGAAGHVNLWVSYVSQPAACVLALWALSLWQTRDLPRQTMRAIVPAVLAVFIVLALTVEGTRSFSAIATPVYALLGLGASLFTLVARASEESESLTRQDWFWITIGMALYFGALAALMPMARLLIGAHQELVVRAWQLFGAIGIIANVLIAVGMLCPMPDRLQPSGVSSSPASSVSPLP